MILSLLFIYELGPRAMELGVGRVPSPGPSGKKLPRIRRHWHLYPGKAQERDFNLAKRKTS